MTDPFRIGILLTSFDAGGTESQMTELIRRLDRRRFAVRVACFRREGPWLASIEEAGVAVDAFPLRSLTSPHTLGQLRALARWCRDHRLQLLQTCDIYGNIVGLAAGSLARVPARVGSRRGIVSPTGRRSLLALQRASYRAADRIVANSLAAAAQLIAEGVPRTRIVVIPNGIDPERFSAPRAPSAAPTITTVANLRHGKGHDVLLRAAARVLGRRPDVRFQVVGEGPLRRDLEQEAARLGVAAAVSFLGHRSDVPEILRSSSAFAFPSLMEAFPNGVMEAMAAGLPVVASNVGGIPELVQHRQNGLLVPAGDHRALADELLGLLADPAAAAAMGARARSSIEDRYSFARMVGDFEALYSDLIGHLMSSSVPIPSRATG